MDGTFRVTAGWRFGDQVVARLVDESGEATLHWFAPDQWGRLLAGVDGLQWRIPEHEFVGPLPTKTAARVGVAQFRAALLAEHRQQ